MSAAEALKLIEQAAAEEWTELDLSGMNLDVLPPEIGKLEKLETLILGKWDKEAGSIKGNNLKTLPDKIAQLQNLKKLEYCYNDLEVIPEAIAKLSNLQLLDLSFNQILEISGHISALYNLQQLYLYNNKIIEIPEHISILANLQQLYLYNNKIIEIPEYISALANLQQLYLSGNKITEIPEYISTLANLQQLYLSENKITEIPEYISTLANLQLIYLYNNQITEIPEHISILANLQLLCLSDNRITEIPEHISALANLQQLYLSDNKITKIPEHISALANLQQLYLSSNKITEIPEHISVLANLQVLDFSYNQITKIPEHISALANLQQLYLFNNQITEIPEYISALSNLQQLDLRRNPIENIPQEILAQSSQQILNFLRQRHQQGRRPLHEAKMLLIGQGDVGKTSLINRLLYNEFDKNESQTDGLNVQDWNIHVNSKNIRLNVWDFGGQEIYHATHQFFLTKRSLYVLVCNCRTSEEENRLEYWLKLIQTFGDASPVIIVGNKNDEQPLDINRKALREKYPNICAILETSCHSGDGIKELSDEIHQEVAKLKEVYDLLPLSWFEVKERLEAMTEDFISYNRYIGICHEKNIPEEQNQEQLIDLLHRLGLVLNFREHPLLQQTNVLKPEWATEGIYALLSDDQLKTESKGIFCCEDLTRILNAKRYPKDRHPYLIGLMKEFELCFALDCNPPRFLIPGILPKDEPEDTELEGDRLEFQYHYRVLPNSIISRFIVNTHEKIHKHTYWRSGVMLEYKEGNETCNIARVKADPEDNKIFIAISGKPETRRTFLGLIRDVFNKLHNSFGNLEVTEWVPVPEHPDHILKYLDLLGLEAMGETHKIIGELRLKLELRKLLDGYESIQRRQQARNEAERIENHYHFYEGVTKSNFMGGDQTMGDSIDQSGSKMGVGVNEGTMQDNAKAIGENMDGQTT